MNTYSAERGSVFINFKSPSGEQTHAFAWVGEEPTNTTMGRYAAAQLIADALNEKEERECHVPCGERWEHCTCAAIKGGSISSGTLRDEDLIPVFMRELAVLDSEVARDLETEGHPPEVLVDELITCLDKCAGEDLYFGTHPDDGADFGFWKPRW